MWRRSCWELSLEKALGSVWPRSGSVDGRLGRDTPDGRGLADHARNVNPTPRHHIRISLALPTSRCVGNAGPVLSDRVELDARGSRPTRTRDIR